MLVHLVTIDEIVTDRTLRDEEGIDALKKDIRKHGQKEPILLRENMVLIDGLRRIEAMRRGGYQVIDAYVTDSPSEVFDILKKSHFDVELEPQRIYEFHKVLRLIVANHYHRIKQAGRWRREDRLPGEDLPSYIDITKEALNLPYAAYVERVHRIYSKADNGDQQAIELRTKVEDGTMGVAAACAILDRRFRLTGDVRRAAQQRDLLEAGIRNLSGVVKALKTLASPLKIPYEQLNPMRNELRYLRSELQIIARKIDQETGTRGSNG